MWNASTHRPRQAGYTMAELMITVAVLSLMALVIERTLSSTQSADRYLNASRTVKERVEKAAFRVHQAVSGAHRLYERNDMGISYLKALDVTNLPPAATARLPVMEEQRPLGPDVRGVPRTGNVLLFVQESDPIVCAADPENEVLRYMDVYHFVCCYPVRTTRRVIPNFTQDALDLAIWYSLGYPSYSQIMSITDVTQRQNVVAHLNTAYGFEYAWDPAAPADSAFYMLSSAGNVAALPAATHVIGADPDLTERGCFVYANCQLAYTVESSRIRRTVFTAPESPPWFPNGFEVKVVGSSGHRKVWFRLVAETPGGRGGPAARAVSLIASVRDL